MPKKIRICKILPVALGKQHWEALHDQLLAEVVHDDVQVDHTYLAEVEITSIADSYDEAMICAAHVKRAIKAEQEGYDAIVLNCLLESGIDACRESVSIPVVGDTISSLHLASLVSTRFSLLLPGTCSRINREMIRKYGFEKKIASLRMTNLSTLSFSGHENPENVQILLEEARIAIDQDGAEAIIGYGGPSIYKTLRKELPVPVISPVQASIIIAQMLVKAKLSQSKIAFPFPEHLQR